MAISGVTVSFLSLKAPSAYVVLLPLLLLRPLSGERHSQPPHSYYVRYPTPPRRRQLPTPPPSSQLFARRFFLSHKQQPQAALPSSLLCIACHASPSLPLSSLFFFVFFFHYLNSRVHFRVGGPSLSLAWFFSCLQESGLAPRRL